MDHKNITDAYTHWSASYDSDRNLTRDLDQQITRRILSGRGFPNVLEIGSGTGKNTAFLTQIGEKILALDFSTGMLSQARRKVDSASVLFAMADLTKAWPCKSGSFQLIACNLVLEHIEDLVEVFLQASRALAGNGIFFISELHPFRQYKGVQAHFRSDEEIVTIPAFLHHLSDFTNAAEAAGFRMQQINEWWHDEDDRTKPPRLISFVFEKIR